MLSSCLCKSHFKRAEFWHRTGSVVALKRVPRVTETTLSTLQSPSVFRPELDTPKSDRFIGNADAALSQKILDIEKAQEKSVVQPDRVADDFGRKSISAVARRVPFHPPSLSDASSI